MRLALLALLAVTTTSFARVEDGCEPNLLPKHRRVYLSVKAPLTYVDGEPYLTVYRGLRDSYRLVEDQRTLDWLFWSARVRLRERELVFNLEELGPLNNPAYDLRVIERELPEVHGLDYITGFRQVEEAQASIRAAMAADDWRLLSASPRPAAPDTAASVRAPAW